MLSKKKIIEKYQGSKFSYGINTGDWKSVMTFLTQSGTNQLCNYNYYKQHKHRNYFLFNKSDIDKANN